MLIGCQEFWSCSPTAKSQTHRESATWFGDDLGPREVVITLKNVGDPRNFPSGRLIKSHQDWLKIGPATMGSRKFSWISGVEGLWHPWVFQYMAITKRFQKKTKGWYLHGKVQLFTLVFFFTKKVLMLPKSGLSHPIKKRVIYIYIYKSCTSQVVVFFLGISEPIKMYHC